MNWPEPFSQVFAVLERPTLLLVLPGSSPRSFFLQMCCYATRQRTLIACLAFPNDENLPAELL